MLEPVSWTHLDPASYRKIPWKNGRGALYVIASEGGEGWGPDGTTWHYGRTAIVEAGPFSDYTGYERLQTVVEGRGLVLQSAGGDIDLREPFRIQRYDGGMPVTTKLESGPVEVVNLIARRALFRIDLRVASSGETCPLAPGTHIVHAAAGAARIDGAPPLPYNHALRCNLSSPARLHVVAGRVLVGSVLSKET